MTKRLLAAVVTAFLILLLAACGGDISNTVSSIDLPSISSGGNSALGADFQKNMNQSAVFWIPYLCEADDGYYFQYDTFAYYIDKASRSATILCAKPDCAHNDDTCNAWIYCWSLAYLDNKLYFSNNDYVLNNGTYTNYGMRLYSIDADGTNRNVVQSLEFTPGGNNSNYVTTPIIHRGSVYFAYNGILYGVSLGDEIDHATAIWGEEIEGGTSGITVVNPNEIQYKLWADGDYIYFMVNLKQSNGTYKDTLFAYSVNEQDVKQVWLTPDASDVGEWEQTGVSVSQWYVTNGYIYFYLSGGDMWRTDLETGMYEKLAETSEKTQYGTAVFSDQYMCLLNDTPSNFIDGISGTAKHTGGDTIYIYGLDGTFLKEISLKELSRSNQIEHCQPVFCSGNDIYFMVDADTWTDRVNGVASRNINQILCCADIESGEITQVYGWN